MRTRTDIALGLVGMYPLLSEIDKRKLNLFGQLCRLEMRSRVKNVFLLRLSSFYMPPDRSQNRYFPDIFLCSE